MRGHLQGFEHHMWWTSYAISPRDVQSTYLCCVLQKTWWVAKFCLVRSPGRERPAEQLQSYENMQCKSYVLKYHFLPAVQLRGGICTRQDVLLPSDAMGAMH